MKDATNRMQRAREEKRFIFDQNLTYDNVGSVGRETLRAVDMGKGEDHSFNCQ